MYKKERICGRCGDVSLVFGKSLYCSVCSPIVRRETNIVADRTMLEAMYSKVEYVGLTAHGKVRWKFIHEDCGTEQEWTVGNIKKRLREAPDHVPCSKCGGKRRMSIAMAAFVEKYRIKDVSEWLDYQRHVRKLTNATYKKYRNEINPMGLPHGKTTSGSTQFYHLDHIKSVIQSYLNGDLPEVVAAPENLQMLTVFENLTKGRK